MAPFRIKLDDLTIISKGSINLLGVLFDSKLNWSEQVTKVVMKASKSLNAIKIIIRFFTSSTLLKLMTSNYYSVLFYSSLIWNAYNLHHQSIQR